MAAGSGVESVVHHRFKQKLTLSTTDPITREELINLSKCNRLVPKATFSKCRAE